jgi:hypothetical protein
MKVIHVLMLALALLLLVTGLALANGGVERPRQVLGGGASDSAAGDVSLQATLGQPVMGVVSGGDVTLEQGFWYSATPEYSIYLPLVIRDYQL